VVALEIGEIAGPFVDARCCRVRSPSVITMYAILPTFETDLRKSNCIFLYISSSTMTKKQCKLQGWFIGRFACNIGAWNPSRLRNEAGLQWGSEDQTGNQQDQVIWVDLRKIVIQEG
jgi:hypothetical protein